MYYKISFLHLG